VELLVEGDAADAELFGGAGAVVVVAVKGVDEAAELGLGAGGAIA